MKESNNRCPSSQNVGSPLASPSPFAIFRSKRATGTTKTLERDEILHLPFGSSHGDLDRCGGIMAGDAFSSSKVIEQHFAI